MTEHQRKKPRGLDAHATNLPFDMQIWMRLSGV